MGLKVSSALAMGSSTLVLLWGVMLVAVLLQLSLVVHPTTTVLPDTGEWVPSLLVLSVCLTWVRQFVFRSTKVQPLATSAGMTAGMWHFSFPLSFFRLPIVIMIC